MHAIYMDSSRTSCSHFSKFKAADQIPNTMPPNVLLTDYVGNIPGVGKCQMWKVPETGAIVWDFNPFWKCMAGPESKRQNYHEIQNSRSKTGP